MRLNCIQEESAFYSGTSKQKRVRAWQGVHNIRAEFHELPCFRGAVLCLGEFFGHSFDFWTSAPCDHGHEHRGQQVSEHTLKQDYIRNEGRDF